MKFVSHASSSAGNLYTVTSRDRTLLLEAGLPIARIRRALDFRLQDVDACLVTHHHGDHARGVAGVMAAGVDVYGSVDTWEALDLLGHRSHFARSGQVLKLDPWRVLPFDVRHDAAGSLGYLIEDPGHGKLMFACDTAYIPYRFSGLTHIAVECNYSAEQLRRSGTEPERIARVLRYHMGLERVLRFLAANDLSAVREIWLLHLSDSHGDSDEFPAAVRRATGKPTYIAQREGEKK